MKTAQKSVHYRKSRSLPWEPIARRLPKPLPLPKAQPGRHNLLVVGLNRRTRNYLEETEAYRSHGVKILGILDVENGHASENSRACEEVMERLEIPHLGTLDRLRAVLTTTPVDEVLVTLPIKSFYDEIEMTLATCEEAGTPASLCTDLFNRSSARMAVIGTREGRTRLNYSCAQHSGSARLAKRALDIAGSLFALTILAIPLIVIAILVKLTSRGPVFFRQERLGLNHRPFVMYKFRTMVQNAEELKKQLEAENEMDGPVFKIKKDPRLTPIGGFLRKFSLDELPQFINVLKGDMSLVGPRPPIRNEVHQYEWWQRRRLSTRPGLTCYWQISGRNNISFEEWMRLDLKYIDNWSLKLDLALIFKTIPAVLLGRGAS